MFCVGKASAMQGEQDSGSQAALPGVVAKE